MSTCEQAAALIARGLAEVHHLSGQGPDEFLALHDLSAGVERLAKAVLWSEHWVRTLAPLTTRALKQEFGHDIRSAIATITQRCFPADYLARPAAVADLDWLRSDARLALILDLLADFGSGGRYFDLDVAGGSAEYGTDSSPSDRLDELANVIAEADPQVRTAQFDASPEGYRLFHSAVQREIKADIERLARALARLFTIGPLSAIPYHPSAVLSKFLTITDEALGHREYRQAGPPTERRPN
jgi:hypothetical protein